MTRIDSAGLTELLRRRLNALTDVRGSLQAPTQRRTEASAKHQAHPSGGSSHHDVATALTKRIQLISPDDSQRERKAFRALLEAMLLAELGESLINDAAFYQMVDHVQQQMESDPQIAKAIQEASMILLSGKLG